MSDFTAETFGIGPPPPPPILLDDPAARQRADLAAFIGRKAGSFLDPPGSRRICWPGLLFPQAWFLYRKLYVWAAILFVAPILVVTLEIPLGVGLYNILGLVVGASGKAIYRQVARTAVGRIRSQSADEDEAIERIRRAGGVSKAGAAIGVLYMLAAAAAAVANIHH